MPLEYNTPSAAYMRELRAVAREAAQLQDYIDKANFLPTDLPVPALEKISSALILLPHGTAEGSIVTLREGHSLCQAIRNEFLAIDDGQSVSNNPDQPLITRSDELGSRIGLLYAAIGDAIEHYKRESGEEINIDIESDDTAPPEMDIGRDAVTGRIDDAQTGARELSRSLDDAGIQQSAQAEQARRTLSDANAQFEASKAEFDLPKPRAGMLEMLGKGVEGTATAFEKTGQLIQASGDIAEPGIKAFF